VLIGVFFFNLTLDFAGTQNRIGLLLFILIVLAFGSMSSIGFMNRERDQFAQERASGAYMPSAFFIVKVFYDLVPLRIIPSAVLGLLVYYLTGLQNDPSQLAHFLLIIILFNSTTVRFLFYFILNFFNNILSGSHLSVLPFRPSSAIRRWPTLWPSSRFCSFCSSRMHSSILVRRFLHCTRY